MIKEKNVIIQVLVLIGKMPQKKQSISLRCDYDIKDHWILFKEIMQKKEYLL